MNTKIEAKESPKAKEPVPTMNFAEYALGKRPELVAAIRFDAKVKNDMEERTKDEWDQITKELQNRRI
jgi:hypothetical protein